MPSLLKSLEFLCKTLLLTIFTLTLISCGGSDGDGDEGGDTASTLSGTAATGVPIDGEILVTDISGSTATAVIDESGNYTVDVTGMSPPFIIAAIPSDTMLATQYSFASQANITVNVTPLTTLTLFNASGQADLSVIQADWENAFSGITQAQIDSAQAIVNANFGGLFSGLGLDPAAFDLFSSPFNADGTGFDGLLDLLEIVLDPDLGEFTIEYNGSSFPFDIDIVIGGGSGAGADLTLSGADTSAIGSSFTTAGQSGFLTMTGISSMVWTASLGDALSMTFIDGEPNNIIFVYVNPSNVNQVYGYVAGCGLPGVDCSNVTTNFETGEVTFMGQELLASEIEGNLATGSLTITGTAYGNVN